jgi:peptidoglycan/xylan/chitin deacetylase (PgdA/CDA1 family)
MRLRKAHLVVLLSSLIFLSYPFSGTASAVEPKTITVVFRYDDYSSKSPIIFEEKIIEAFKTYHLASTFAVIPYVTDGKMEDPSPQGVIPLSADRAEILKEAMASNVVQVAQHGYSHQTRASPQKGVYTEFDGLDYDSQRQRIIMGKELLEKMLDKQIVTFVPPWNSYDLNTLRVLEELNFSTISASLGRPVKDPSPLNFLPETASLLQLQDAIQAARKSRDARPIVVVLFHPFDFKEVDKDKGKVTFQQFEDILKWVSSQEDVRVLTVDQTVKLNTDLGSHLYRSYLELVSSQVYHLSPPFIVPRLLYYPSGATIHEKKLTASITLPFFYLVILAGSTAATFFVGLPVFRRSRFLDIIARYGSLVLLCTGSIFALRNLAVSYRGAALITCLVGLCVGMWTSSLRVKKQRALKAS